MNNLFKASLVTLLTIAPLVAREYWGSNLGPAGIGLIAVLAFVGYWKWVFKPDNRFEAVRTPGLDTLFAQAFSEFAVRGGGRFPLRVNVYQCRGCCFAPWLCRRLPALCWLHVAYNWSGRPSDADFGKVWRSDRGLCGKVYQTGRVGWYRRDEHGTEEYRLDASDLEQTRHVQAVLCIPLRRARPKPNSHLDPRLVGVLAIDALTTEGADFLEGLYDQIESQADSDLLDKAEVVSLYFQ